MASGGERNLRQTDGGAELFAAEQGFGAWPFLAGTPGDRVVHVGEVTGQLIGAGEDVPVVDLVLSVLGEIAVEDFDECGELIDGEV